MHQSDGYQEIHSDHFGFAYGTADIMCSVPSACVAPTHIAVSATGELPQTADGVCSEKLKHWFVEVKNQERTSQAFRYNFTVCLSTMFDFTNVLQLVQSLEMMKLLGVNRVAVYQTSCNTDTQRVLDYYTETGLVEVIHWSLPRFVNVSRSWLPQHGPGDLHYFGQLAALNDCLYRYMYQSTYLAMQDIDELILPQSVDSWVELLPTLERKHGAIHCYKFKCYVFPTVALNPPSSSGSPQSLWTNTSGVNILEHLHHEPPNSETKSNYKIILDPRAVFSVTVHGTLKPWDQCHWVDKNVARIYHTRAPKQTNLTKEQLVYDDRLLSYSARLTPAVTAVLRRSNQKHC
uniref:Glycosyltransferase family 92 protein n=2 Tax=Gouania willdenowi TaxID=441366 RepID=A0A8C5DSW7_GOUWI